MHQHVGVRMAVQTFTVREFHSAQEKFPPRHQLVHIVADANVIHARAV